MQSDCFVRQHELVAVEPRRPLGYLHRGHLKADFPRLGQWILGPVLCERQEDAAMWFHAWGRSVEAHNFLRRRGGTLPPRRSRLGAERWLLAWLCWWSPCRYLQAQWLQCPSPCVSSSFPTSSTRSRICATCNSSCGTKWSTSPTITSMWWTTCRTLTRTSYYPNLFVTSCVSDAQNYGKMQTFHVAEQPFAALCSTK